MANILDKIIADKRHEVRSRKEKVSLEELKEQVRTMPKCRNFYKAITKPNRRGINVIAEVKKASPSQGIIREDFEPVAIAQTYKKCGADAISVLIVRLPKLSLLLATHGHKHRHEQAV